MEFLLLWIGCAIVTGLAAGARGRSSGGWGALGFLFGPFALVAVLVMPSLKVVPASPSMADTRKQLGYDQPPSSPPTVVSASSISVADELEKLAALRDRGVLTEEEFQSRKQLLLRSK